MECKHYLVVETDNFGGDYPNEKFAISTVLPKEHAQKIADVYNSVYCSHPTASRYWKVVEEIYKLQPGFEP